MALRVTPVQSFQDFSDKKFSNPPMSIADIEPEMSGNFGGNNGVAMIFNQETKKMFTIMLKENVKQVVNRPRSLSTDVPEPRTAAGS